MSFNYTPPPVPNPFRVPEKLTFELGTEVMYDGKRWMVSAIKKHALHHEVYDLIRKNGDMRSAVPLQYVGAITALDDDRLKS